MKKFSQEALIQQAVNLLSAGIDIKDIFDTLIEQGASNDLAYLAIEGAKFLYKDREVAFKARQKGFEDLEGLIDTDSSDDKPTGPSWMDIVNDELSHYDGYDEPKDPYDDAEDPKEITWHDILRGKISKTNKYCDMFLKNAKGESGSKKRKRNLGYNEEEGFHTKQYLTYIKEYADELYDMIDNSDDLPEWVQSKIAAMAEQIGQIREYIKYKLESMESNASVAYMEKVASSNFKDSLVRIYDWLAKAEDLFEQARSAVPNDAGTAQNPSTSAVKKVILTGMYQEFFDLKTEWQKYFRTLESEDISEYASSYE